MTEVVGIDLGTTTTKLSVYGPEYGAELVENDRGKLVTPSVVAYAKKELLLPGDQRKVKIGELAESTTSKDHVVIYDAKRIIGKKLYDQDVSTIRSCFKHSLVADEAGSAVIQIAHGDDKGTYSNIYPQVVSAEILKYVGKCYLRKRRGVTNVRAVVSIPAVFKENQRAATYEAAKIAQIDIVQLVSEPTAAAVQYLCGESVMSGMKKNGKFLVFDLGGGTLDVSIVESSKDGKEILVKAVDGDPLLGGRDFDNILAQHIEPILKTNYDIDMETSLVTEKNEKAQRERAKHLFMLECRSIKEALSTNEEVPLNMILFNTWKGDISADEIIVTREQFEKKLTDNKMSDRIFVPVIGALKKAELRKEDISAVLLAGGGCRMPIITQWLTKFFGKTPILQARNVDHVVSQGAAIIGHNKGIKEVVKITETLNFSLGIQVKDNRMGWILPNKTKLPAKQTSPFTNVAANQTRVVIVVKQGVSEVASENLTLYEQSLDITPLPAGSNKIHVTFEMDDSQMLSMHACDTSIPNKAIQSVLALKGRITDENINRLASGDISVTKERSPTEKKLDQLTSHFYRTCDAVQAVSHVSIRKSQLRNLNLVDTFVQNARGESILVTDIEQMEKVLQSIDSDLGSASGPSLMHQARASGPLRSGSSIRKFTM